MPLSRRVDAMLSEPCCCCTRFRSQILTVSQKFKRMQEAKVPVTDPEYIKAHRLLAAVQQNQQFRKMQQQQQMQAAQHRAQVQSQGQPMPPAANGVNGKTTQGSFDCMY